MASPPHIPAPPPLRAPGPPAPIVRDHFARNIAEVCKVQPGVLPMNCYSTANLPRNLPSGRELLQPPAGPLAALSEETAQKLLSALASKPNGNNALVTAVTDHMTIRGFLQATDAEQLQFLNDIWNALTTSHAFDTLPANMYDPAYDAPVNVQPLPTTWRPPAPPAVADYHKRLAGRRIWQELGVGFRVDGKDQSSIDRVVRDGMKQQRISDGFMLGTRGLNLKLTVMMDTTRARVWTGNHDIFNESAVCVSRNFFGATAFPERSTSNRVFLWAVNCSDLRGFDTENHQLALPNSKQWRPGEKAFHESPRDHIIGYVPIDRRGAPTGGGWRVDIASDAKWTFTGQPSVRQRGYLEDELAAWRGNHTIPPAFDFAT